MQREILPEQAAYLGNDHNDLECLTRVGCGVAVADAFPSVKSAASVVLSPAADRVRWREMCDLLLNRLGELTS